MSIIPATAYAQSDWGPKCSVGGVATIEGIECVFSNIVAVATPLVGILLFVMLVIGALKFITSGGDAKKTKAAQQALTYAIVGVFVFFGIWFILQLIKSITGVNVTNFEVR